MKTMLCGYNVFTQRKIDSIHPFSEKLEVIVPEFRQYEVLDINEKDSMASLLDEAKFQVREMKMQDIDWLRDDLMKEYLKSKETEKKCYFIVAKVKY